MPTNILADLNVVLDVLLERDGYRESLVVLKLGEGGTHRLHISAHAVTTFAYLLEHAKIPQPQVKVQLAWLLETFTVVSIDTALLKAALQSNITDYEDAVVEQAAIACGAETIVTRNVKDFTNSVIPALTPGQFLSK